jgi:hypothetical protein
MLKIVLSHEGSCRIRNTLNQWFPKCAPRRPFEPRLPHRGTAKYYTSFIILFPFSIQCHRTQRKLFGEASVNGRFRRSYQLNIVVIKSSEVFELFFLGFY